MSSEIGVTRRNVAGSVARAAPGLRPISHRPTGPEHGWADTLTTVHMWTQIVGKIRMAATPPLNHWWHVPLYVTAHGLTTSPMPHGDRLFQIDFDFVDHRLVIEASDGRSFAIDLRPMSVAAFYRTLMRELQGIGIAVPIRTNPVEVVVAIPFDEDDEHASYEREHVAELWSGLRAAHRRLTAFRGGFIGKASPIHFFWGGFDLAVTRFSGRPAPLHPGSIPNCPDWVMYEAYSHEVSSAGWWPTSPEVGPAYYSYMYPQPAGFDRATVQPDPARYDTAYGEFVLREEDLRREADPERAVMSFLESTYDAGATLAAWDRGALERAGRTTDGG